MTPLSDALTAAHEAQMDAQFAELDADLFFYARGFPLAEFTDVPLATESPREGTEA